MKIFRSLFLSDRFFIFGSLVIVLLVISNFTKELYPIAVAAALLFAVLIILEIILIYGIQNGIEGQRDVSKRLSNGDDNQIYLFISNNYPFKLLVNIIDEVPHQFQVRNTNYKIKLDSKEMKTINYSLRPTERGEYNFGYLNVFCSSLIGLVERRFRLDNPTDVPVYPSFLQMRKYEFLAISNKLTEYGVKKIRRIGFNYEFDQIKKYVQGDDFRSINWKATARTQELMVNQYQDERAQNIYCLINMGRVMKMPFEEMTLLDYSINSTLVLLNIALVKGDKAGLIMFSEQIDKVLPASLKGGQINKIMEILYKQQTKFLESNYESLYHTLHHRMQQRSLVLMYTNFESLSSLKRELPFLKLIARKHLLVVIFFDNTEVNVIIEKESASLEDIYIKTIANKFKYEKKLIVKELQRNGIHGILTTPKKLTVDSINKYLELKARGLI